MAGAKLQPVYLVEEILWEMEGGDPVKGTLPHVAKMTQPHYSRKGYVLVFNYHSLGCVQPIKAFLDPVKAAAFCKEQEDNAWEGINPFRYGGGLRAWTSLDGGRLRDRLLDIGLEPPVGKVSVEKWRKWYDVASASVSDMQKLEVRQALDRLHFFRVSELTE